MATYYAKRALEILREEGPVEIYFSVYRKLNLFLSRISLMVDYSQKSIPSTNRVYEVPVSDIDSYFGWTTVRRYFGGKIPASPVWQGEWDNLETNDIYESYTYDSFADRFKYNKGWEQTNYYKKLTKDWRNENKSHGEALRRLERYDDIYYDIKSNGFNIEYPIEVVITRNGEYIIWDGKHRFTIAKLLDLESVPVEVRAVHSSWLKLRDEIHNNGLPEGYEDLRDHPDLQDVL